jgi:hypothetical protein
MWWSYLPQVLYSLTTPFSNIFTSSFFPYGERPNFYVHKEQEITEKNHYTLLYVMVSGNSWGSCGDGTGALGCGPQETFRTCSDIAIS